MRAAPQWIISSLQLFEPSKRLFPRPFRPKVTSLFISCTIDYVLMDPPARYIHLNTSPNPPPNPQSPSFNSPVNVPQTDSLIKNENEKCEEHRIKLIVLSEEESGSNKGVLLSY